MTGPPGLREMTADALLTSILAFLPHDHAETVDRQRIADFIQSHDRPFDRAHLHGHLTASALILNATGTAVLLGKHRKLNRWLQMGGHGEPGETSAEAVALREATEESGLTSLIFHPAAPRPFDLDVHVIPARGDVPEHSHFDIRFLLTSSAGCEAQHLEEEHLELRWFKWEDALQLDIDPALARMMNKARALTL
jgi:8-oxo-dGTP pyrophosphatase MutT (NUDIX family)